jgi:hypothetical protein
MGRTTRDLDAAQAIGQFFGLTIPTEPPKTR